MAVAENITVLFTDLVGSTNLAASLNPEVGDEVLRGHFSVLRRSVAETGGTEVKGLGDGNMVVFATFPGLNLGCGLPQAPADPASDPLRETPGALHGLERRRQESGSKPAPASLTFALLHARHVPGAPRDSRSGDEVSQPMRKPSSQRPHLPDGLLSAKTDPAVRSSRRDPKPRGRAVAYPNRK